MVVKKKMMNRHILNITKKSGKGLYHSKTLSMRSISFKLAV
jgi:hypothetical protein